jgi:RNA polymerase sigma-70 factor (ECF subfamily)
MRSIRRSKTQGAGATADVPDAALVEAAKADPGHFGALFDRYWEIVFRYCYFRSGNWHEAEDLASRVFLNALNGLSGFRNDPHKLAFQGWLFTIARNVIANRGRGQDARATIPLELAVDRASLEPGPEDLALASDARRRVQELLSGLAPNQRALLELRMAGLSTAEIGQVMGMSTGAVRTAQFRAMTALQHRTRSGASELAEVSHD